MATTIETICAAAILAHAANSTASSFASKIPTTTEPTGDGVISVGSTGHTSRNNVEIMPFGAGADNTTFDMRVLGWRKTKGAGTALWVPRILAQFSCTLSAAVGVAGADVVATDRFADTITQTSAMGNTNVDTVIVSPANDTAGHIILDAKGCSKVEVIFDMTGATNGNALVAEL